MTFVQDVARPWQQLPRLLLIYGVVGLAGGVVLAGWQDHARRAVVQSPEPVRIRTPVLGEAMLVALQPKPILPNPEAFRAASLPAAIIDGAPLYDASGRKLGNILASDWQSVSVAPEDPTKPAARIPVQDLQLEFRDSDLRLVVQAPGPPVLPPPQP